MSLSEPELGAGGVVIDERGAVLLLKYRGGGWTFPKGHLDPGERDEDAAVREVLEETGVRARVVAPLPPTRYTNDRGTAREIHWFLMRAERRDAALEPIFDAGGFYPTEEAFGLLSYPEDQELLREALRRASV
ncbi:NUDIX hydrolase [Deinococcus pimensis]|uniref:NUDIX hydrolase n=1 Tax=Deinococcus pimensis TaxID=309888 RepID=UPI0004864871|nr:NUDIX hydrolase [Deinococcus pimensis]